MRFVNMSTFCIQSMKCNSKLFLTGHNSGCTFARTLASKVSHEGQKNSRAQQTQATVFWDSDSAEKGYRTPLRPFTDVPGPKGLPLVGTLWDYIKKDGFRFNKLFESYIARAKEYGPIHKEKIGVYTNVVVNDPMEYSKVVREEAKNVCPYRLPLEPMKHYRVVRGIGLGLVNAQGEEWQRLRSILSKKMLTPREVTEYCKDMNDVGDDLVRRLTKLRRETDGEVYGLEYELFKWAMESIGTVLFDERIGCLQDRPHKDVTDFIENLIGFFKNMQVLLFNLPVYKFYQTETWEEFEKHSDQIMKIGRDFVNKKIKKLFSDRSLKNNTERNFPTLLEYLLSNETLTPEEAAASVLDLLIGSVETTSNATLWTLYMLAKNPSAQEKLYQELRHLLPNNEEITPSNLSQMHYVKACLKETFRFYPLAFSTSRILQNNLEVAGYNVPKGSHIQANLCYMNQNPKLFPEPNKFKPERWLRGEGIQVDKEANNVVSLVWGHGPRMCIGRRYAEQEIYLAISKVIQNFKLEYRHPDVQVVLHTVMNPDRPVRLTFIPRK